MDKLGLQASVFTFSLIFAITAIQFMIQDENEVEFIQRPTLLDYENCDVARLSSLDSSFLIEINHSGVSRQTLTEYHDNPLSQIFWQKTDNGIKIGSGSRDNWFIQVSLEYNDDQKEKEIIIYYETQETSQSEKVKFKEDQWCRIFEVTTVGTY